MSEKCNKIISFLKGKWFCKNIIVIPNSEIIKSEYKEKMVIKNYDTVEITAFGIKDGEDLTKDMTIKLENENNVTLIQDDYMAQGKMEGNLITLSSGLYEGDKYKTRLYLMEDKFIYQQDVWNEGKVGKNQISYLKRI